MNDNEAGRVFIIADENKPVKNCTVSRQILNSAICFSLDSDTDISAEIYMTHKIIINSCGELVIYYANKEFILQPGESFVTPANIPVGFKTKTGSVYTEINLKEDSIMNQALKPGKVFKLAELVPYQPHRIVNMDLINSPALKFVVMAFDSGTGLSEHAAPGEALIFALDGEAIIGYEGQEHAIKAGESFKFAKNGRHWVKAVSNFKMALLLTLEV